jgi:hypothetical protein
MCSGDLFDFVLVAFIGFRLKVFFLYKQKHSSIFIFSKGTNYFSAQYHCKDNQSFILALFFLSGMMLMLGRLSSCQARESLVHILEFKNTVSRMQYWYLFKVCNSFI